MNRFLLNGLTSVFVSLGLSGASHAGLGAGGGYSYQGGRRGSSGGAYAGLLAQGSAAALPVGNALSAGWERTPAPRSTADELELANATATKELVIIDAAVPEKHRIYEQRAAGVAFEVLREGESGLAQLTAILSRYRNLEALHIFSHAQDGALYLGDSVVNKEALSQEINTLASMDRAMKDGADVMFYGCNLAQSEKGEALLELVSAAAHVDVAASNDLTGAEGLGGDWDLEIKKGDIKTRPRFDSIAMVDYTSILPFSGTLALGNMPTGYANAKSYTISGTSYTIKVKSGGSGSKDLYNYNTGYVYVSTNTSLQTTTSVYFTGGETFSLSSIYIYQGFGAPTKTIRITSSKGGTQDSSGPVSASSGTTISFSGAQWTDITSFTIQYADSTTMHWVKLDNIALTNLQSGKDSDGTLTASAVVTEPVGLSSTVDTAGEAVNLFDFTLTDGGGGDGLPMTVSQVVLNVTGTSSDTERGNIIWRLNGNDASFVAGSYNGASDTVTFSSLSISVADNSSETYTVSGYYGTPTGLTEDHTIILSVDGDSDLVVGASGTQMASGQSAVTNGSGTTLDIVASQLTFSTQPAGSTSGSALTTQPVVAATDIFSNVDVDYASDISLSESSSGVLSGTTTKTPVIGVATFTNVAYTATADQENFALTATASGLSNGTSNTVTSDVVATQLIFSTQPAPTSIDSGSSTSFTTVPVVQAVDGSSTLDVGYSTNIALSVTDPNDGVLDGTVNSMSGTGDGDGSGTTVTLTPSSGSATYTNLALQYTNGGATDTIALKATSGGLSSANSSSITSTINNAPVISNLNGDSVSWAGVGGTVNLDSGGDASGSDTELDALNGGNGDYSGGTLTVQRVGGAVTSDLFGFNTSGAAFTVNGSDLQSLGQSFASFTNANGVLSITFNSSSTTATTALVSNVMSRITYRNDTPGGNAAIRFTLSDGSKSTTADATVQSDSIYITNTTDTASIDQTNGVSFSEAIAIANADVTGTQTLILASTMAGQTISATSASSLAESLTLDLDSATGATISGGTLTLGGGVTLTMNNGSGDTGSIGTIFAGTGSLSKTGAGTLTLTGIQTYSGATTISVGALSIASDSNVGSGQLVLNGGTLDVTGSTTINNAINVAADSTFSVSSSVTASGLLSGSNALTKIGASTLTLSNTGNSASFSGAITVSAGTLAISSDANLSSSAITLDSGSLNLTGATFTVDNSIVLGAGGGTVTALGGAKVLSGVVSGSGSFSKTGGPALTLSGVNTFSGGASINGTNGLIVTDSSNLGSGNVTLKLNSLLSVTGSGVTIANNLTMEDSATLSNANNITWSGVISGSGSLTKSGAGTLTLSGSQTQTGGLNVTAGSVSIAGDGNLGSGTLTLDGGSLIVTGSGVTIDNALSLGASNGTISHANALTWSGVISGSGGLTKTGAGTLTLSATNTNTGSIALSAGTMDVSGAVGGAVSVASGTTLQGEGSISGLVTVNSGATLQIGSSPGDLTLGNGLTVNSGGTLVTRINGTTAGSSYDQYNVTGTVTLGGTLSVIGSYTGSGGESFVIISNDASDAVSGIFNGLSEGDKSTTLNGLPLTVSYLGSSGNDVALSIVAPTVTDAKISISGGSGTSGAYKIGDTVTAIWDDTGSGDNNGDITGVNVNFSAFGGGSSVAASNSANTWTATYLITSGSIDGTNLNVSVTATDVDGLSKTTADTTGATVDNVAPSVTSGNISLSGGSGTSGAYKTGDIVTATWNNTSGGENNSDTISSVSVDFSAFGGSSVAASNSSDTWTATYTILSGAIDATNQNVTVTATDNAGNTKATAGADNVTVDNVAPTLTDAKVSISGATGTSGAYKIGDIVTATWNDTAATGDNNSDTISTVTVNFTAFGGGAPVSASNSSDTWTATYTLVAGAIDSSNLNISVTATDNAGNTAFVSDTSNATVDTQAPTVSSVTSSTGNGSYKAGDGVSIQILFDQSVFVSGTPQLQLETGATDQNVNYASGSGGSTLNFAYTVQSGDTSTDLDYTGTGALGLNGGSIVDDAGNEATLTLAVPGATNSLGANKALVIDTTAPTLSLITPVTTPTNDNTPNITFSTDEAGALSLGGSCGTSSSLTIGSTGNHSITLTQTDNSSALSDGTYSDCTVTVTDAVGNASTALAVTAFTVDTTAPSGHSVSFDDSTINASEAASQSFTFASAEVGASYSYSISSSGGGTTVTGNGTITSASQQVSGLNLSGLNDGTLTLSVTLTDPAGNAATAVTNTTTLDKTAPAGHSVSFDDSVINASEASSQSFTFASAEVGAGYSYSITSAGGGTPVTGSGSVSSANQQISGVNLSGLSDGTLTLSVTLTDAAGNAATAVTNTTSLDQTAPSGQSVSFDDSVISASEAVSQSFTFANAEVGASFSYSVSSSGGGTPVTGSGTVTSAGQQVSSLNLSGLNDGALTLSVTLSDTAGNAASAVTNTATLDQTAPSGHSVSFDDSTINASEVASQSFTFASAEVGASYSYSISSSGGGTTVTGNGTIASASQQITSLDLSGLADGTLTLSVILTDTSGNAATAVTNTAALDTTTPSGHSVSFDDGAINATEAASQSFTFASAEVGATFSYSISSSGGGTNVTGSGSLTSATQQVTGVNVSGLSDGTLTLSVVVTDASGNAATAVTANATLDATAPTLAETTAVLTPTSDTTPNVGFSTTEAGTLAVGGSCGSAAEGAVPSGTQTITLTGTDNSSVLADGTYSDCTLTVTDAAGNASAALTLTSFTVDSTAPSGFSVAFNDTLINASEASASTFVFTSGETGSEYNYSVTSSGGGTAVTGSGTLSSASQSITLASLSGLSDGSLTLSVTLTDVSGNVSAAQTAAATLDATAPTPSLSSTASDPTNAAFTVSISFGETVSGFVVSDIVAGNASLSSFTDNGGGSYSVTATPSADGTVTLDISASVAQDTAGNANAAATQFSIVYDGTAPTPVISSFASNPTNAAFSATIAFGETVSGFAVSDIVAGNASLSGFTDNGSGNYSVTVTPTADGSVTLDIAASAAQDTAGNNSAAATQFSLSYDGSGPTLSSSTPANGAVDVEYNATLSLTFDEDVATGSGSATQISLYRSADDELVEAIEVSSSQVVISGATVTVDPTDNFTPNQGYYVRIGAEALTDTLGNAYAGLTSGLSFTVGNHVPDAAADTATTDEDVAVSIKVLNNDTDVDSQINPASVLVTAAPSHGVAKVSVASGVVVYEPEADYNGADSFSYTVEDVHGGVSAAALVSITVGAVNDAPIAVADVAATNTGAPVSIDVAANDTDIDDAVDATTLTIVATPSQGAAVVNAGKIDYTPVAGFSGSDSFSYTVKDGQGALSNVAIVIVNVNGSNVLPNAANDSATTDEDTAVDIAVLDNDTDSDGVLQASTVTLIANASHGAATVNATTGVIRYEPEENYHGADSFTYIVKDNGGSASNIATVAVTVNSVNDAPVAKNDAARILEVSAHAINVLANDMDVDGVLQSATVEIVAAPLHGVVNINVSTGAVSYTPSSTFSGTDQFQYRVKDDSDALSNTATVTLTTGSLNDAPLANNDSATTNEDAAVVIEILDNDQDVDGVLDASAISIESAAGKGAVTDNGDGTLTYTPDANVFGSDSFEYSVKDDAGDSSNTATVTIAIAPVNDAPTISGTATASILEGQAYSFTPTLVDVDSGALTVTATNRPSWLSLNATTGALTGTPAVGSAGVYSGIVLSVSDGQASASLAAFSITVIGDNDTDGVANDVDTDDDNDGMSDSFELLYGFNPFDSSDAAGDLDGDTISNYQEFVDNTNPNDANDYVDITPPVVVAPEDITIDAIALYTPVTLRQMLGLASNASDSDVEAMLAVLATDNVDGADCCSVRAQGLLNNTALLPPGRNLITYRGVDRKGNAATATQVVNIRPLVSVNKDQISVEGATVQFRVILNGQSPFYPLTIPYVIDSLSTASSSDHNLVDGSVTFTKSGNLGQTEASVSITLTADSITENDERLIIRLDDRTTNAEDLAGGYDPTNIYDINAGAKIRHVITIVERNVAPDVTLRLRQNGVDTIQVTPDGGPVTVVATVTDPNPGDTHTYNWSATDNSLVDTDGNASNAQLVFSPASLASGRYKVQLTVADASNATDEAKLYFRVVAALPTLDPTVDSDGDGVNDAEEGVADGDDDGIPDYLDNITATNVLPEVASETSSYLVECDPGVRCRLGQFAILGSNGGARLEPEELQTLPDINTDDLFEPQGGVFDFEVHDLATLGQSVRVVLPQDEPLPEGGVYRKFQNNNWTTFVVDANNELHSAPGNPGYCPPPGDDSWEVGLISGYYCLQLTIEDGGPNDADGLVNAAVEDPGVVAVDKRTPSDIDSEGGGSGGGAINWTLLLALLGLSILSRRYLQLRASVLAAFLMVSLGAPDVSQAADWEAMKTRLMDRGYLEFGAYHASGSQEAGEFKRGLESEDVTVSINNYDVSRYGYQFLAGYRYHPYMAAEIGFLDLGNVKVSMSASALTSEALKNAVEKHYPVSGSGWTLSNRFLWPVREQITLSAEVGLFLWEGDIQLSGADINPDLKGDTDPILGLGLNYRLHKNIDASIRLKRAFFDGQHVDLLGVGAVWRFKGY
ncbi:tandem-95 repeat protein [Hahella sp. HN01]|uniref:tandem-95 repeat protein n=1 Tax=Hahella sp. HN01 TaxID=2847262 RepID=UPI001C1E9E56|nr:Ig-like domain-containing protein [Hahella sp. HN01]MBU6953421.1 tandem-95 repeat protein [Hahella sp. HN01]